MPLYYFNLKNQQGVIADPEGTELADELQAREHANAVARELMCNSGTVRRSWRLEICDAAQRPCFEVLFATVDDTIEHLPPEIRANVEAICGRTASLEDAIFDVRMSLRQIRSTMARIDGIPYLAAVNGKRIDGAPP